MKNYYVAIFLLSLGFSTTGCMNKGTPSTTSGETSNASTSENQPIKLNINKRFVKHRTVNRRLIHRNTQRR